ncbi:MAG: serine/threonine-protein kinase [Gemmatimonadaceae bacterium]
MTDPRQPIDPLFISFQSALAGRYSIDRELGRGGMGVVYLAREVHLDRFVAIKLLPPEFASRPALRERFLREAQLAAKLSHPNIIPIHSVEQIDGFVFFVMAYVDGETLAQRVQSRGPLSATDAIRVLREVAWALGYAHGQGLVHRDVKPDNILLESATGRALVADFGIAAATGDAQSENVTGTPEFMSPEQALGEESDARSDLYSLGATAFYALSGRLPFEGKTATQTLARQVTSAAPSLNSAGTQVPRKLAQLVDRCLEKEPANRPASAQALADELGLAIEKRRELPAALRAFVKRNGRMDGGGTVLSLLGTVVVATIAAATLGPAAAVLTFGASVMAIPIGFGIVAAKRLQNLGFTQDDLRPAFRAEQESSREERSLHLRGGFSWRSMVEGTFKRVARVSASAGAVTGALAVMSLGTPRFALIGSVAILALVIAALSTFGYLVLMQLRRDVDVEFWSAVWTGRFGAFSFSVARKLRGTKPVATAMTHRATEMSLGLAAEQLFESLPKATRESLGDVPQLLQRLQRDANLLRTRYDALQDALNQAGPSAETDPYAPIREERDNVQARMRDTVGALETTRLGLLRLHAGSMTLEGLTTHVGSAVDMTAHLERMFAAQVEVNELLKLPARVDQIFEVKSERAVDPKTEQKIEQKLQLTPV